MVPQLTQPLQPLTIPLLVPPNTHSEHLKLLLANFPQKPHKTAPPPAPLTLTAEQRARLLLHVLALHLAGLRELRAGLLPRQHPPDRPRIPGPDPAAPSAPGRAPSGAAR